MSTEAGTRGVLYKKEFLKVSQNSQENICARVSFLIEFCEIFNNTFFTTEHLRTTASAPTYSLVWEFSYN